MKAEKGNKKDRIVLPLIVLSVVILGVIILFILQKLSVNNKFICKYLGGLWEKKESDPLHRCYSYEEFYK